MFNHEPANYTCPFCLFVRDSEDLINDKQDIVYQDHLITGFIAPQWCPNNEGHVLIIPNEHFENVYDLPRKYAYHIQDLVREIALAFKYVYKCHGVSTRQHNEPAGNQDVWHYHLHIFPRYDGDDLYHSIRQPGFAPLEKRRGYATRLKKFLAERDISE